MSTVILLQYHSFLDRRDIQELKDELKDEREKRTRLQVRLFFEITRTLGFWVILTHGWVKYEHLLG